MNISRTTRKFRIQFPSGKKEPGKIALSRGIEVSRGDITVKREPGRRRYIGNSCGWVGKG